MSVEHGRASLEDAWVRVHGVWSDAQRSWRDHVCARFEQDHWNEAEQAVDQARHALQALAEAVARALPLTHP